MTKENAHLFLPLVQALADGKTIQIKSHDNGETLWDSFGDDSNIRFVIDPEKYRIKPEPRTFEMWLTPMGNMVRTDLAPPPPIDGDWERITVQEVLE